MNKNCPKPLHFRPARSAWRCKIYHFRFIAVFCLLFALLAVPYHPETALAENFSSAEAETTGSLSKQAAGRESGEVSELAGSSSEGTLSHDENSLTSGTAGSVSFPDGKTVVVTILADDSDYSWTDSSIDATHEHAINDFLGIACDYLTQQAANYSRDLTFVSDFEENDDLLYHMNISGHVGDEEAETAAVSERETATVSFTEAEADAGYTAAADANASADHTDTSADAWENSDEATWHFIDSSVPSAQLLEKYNAVNILYLVCINSDKANQGITATRSWYEGMPYPYEFVDLFYIDSQLVNPPAVYAHEMLHTFGAPDLYMAYEDDGVTDEVVQWVEANRPNDIMLTCSDLNNGEYLYDMITNDVTDITAWYIGWNDAKPAGMP